MRSLCPCLWGATKVVIFESFKRCPTLFRVARVTLCDVATCFITWQKYTKVVLQGFQKMTCIFCGTRHTLDAPIFILRGKRSTLDVWYCVFFANRIVRAVSSGDDAQIESHFAWQRQYLVQICCVSHVILNRRNIWDTLHFTLHTLHLTLHTLHFTLHTLHFTLNTLHFPLHTVHFTFHSMLHTLHFTLYNLHFALDTPHFTVYTLHFKLYPSHFILYTPRSTLYTSHFTLIPHTRLYTFTLRTLHATLYTLHSTLYSLHFTLMLHTRHFTLHPTLYTLHSTLHTLHSALDTLHFTLHTLHFTLDTRYSTLHTPQFPLHTLHTTFPPQHPIAGGARSCSAEGTKTGCSHGLQHLWGFPLYVFRHLCH